ncbi:MAG TPA: hypothetical protein PLP29_01770 [Candidatus Ozemobacteraceae bacterium]|nr:hypothetical protein [Candidatus Ozemobacteraceae bacterium]
MTGRAWLTLAVFLLSFALLTGCGGGGGTGGDGDADPLYPEITAQVDGFLAAVNRGDFAGAKAFVDTNMTYYSQVAPTTGGYGEFTSRLEAFLQGSSERDVLVVDRGVISYGESEALFVGTLSCSWKDAGGQTHVGTPETVELFWNRVGTWGIRKVSGHADQGLAFPPVP